MQRISLRILIAKLEVCAQVEVKATKIRGDEYVVLEAKKSYDGKPAFMQGFADNLEKVNQIPGNDFVGVYN